LLVAAWFWSRADGGIAQSDVPRPLPDQPSIAVLPFVNLSSDREQGFLATGLTQDLTTALYRMPGLFVTVYYPAPSAEGEANPAQIAQQLGVKYVLKGSVRKAGDRIRINTVLIDQAGGQAWSEYFDRSIENLFDTEDAIIRQVLIELQVKLVAGPGVRVIGRGTRNFRAWLLAAEGVGEFKKFTLETNARARELYQAAHDADPDWARPLAGLASTFWNSARFGWSTSKEDDIRTGIRLAESAIALQPDDSGGYQALANLYIESGQHAEGAALWEKAFAMAPTDVNAIQGFAWNLLWVGEEKRALALYDDAKQLLPSPPWALLAAEGLTRHVAGQYDAAIDALIAATKRSDHLIPHSRLAAVYADLGRLQEARGEVAWIQSRQPDAAIEDFTRIFRFQDPKKTDWYAVLLEKAGLPHRQTEISSRPD
jgi:adenylate cyclase